MHDLLPRLWFQHFTGTSWVAEDGRRTPVGFLVGFISPDRPGDGVHPHGRRRTRTCGGRGLATRLYERFFEDARARGVHAVHAVTWPGNRISVAFHTRWDSRPPTEPGTQRLYGTAA